MGSWETTAELIDDAMATISSEMQVWRAPS